MAEHTHLYTNGEITVAWKPGICIHSGIDFKGLAEALTPGAGPGIIMSNAETVRIIAQVKRAPVAH